MIQLIKNYIHISYNELVFLCGLRFRLSFFVLTNIRKKLFQIIIFYELKQK